MFGKLTTGEIEEVLNNQLIGRIGCHNDDITYVVPVSYAYDGDYIYGHTEEGLKINIMRQNPKICFQTDSMEDMANWKSVIAWGEFEELTDPEERKKALEKLIARNLPLVSSETVHLSPQWPFVPQDISSIKGIVYRVKLKDKTGRFEKSNGRTFMLPD
ncbi:MAG: pyridoxamine 5'-phosphate oxidase family protein [Bacteroidota bacterium]|nr:pyridoxamine 5'-phosphate oxidase family protein [Bacteroidota bacterium]